MKATWSSLAVFSTIVPAALARAVSDYSSADGTCTSLTSEEVRFMGNNTLFTRWRSYSHMQAPAGWINDPCGPMYDPWRDEYHIMYQWHPNHVAWGNISWGHAKSKDMISWTDVGGWENDNAVALAPSGNDSYDGLGIFSGTAHPVNMQGEEDGTILALYTSVGQLPTHWTSHYWPYTETQSLASSKDGGLTWEKYENNPVINHTTGTAPMYWNVTGMRDPAFEPSPALDNLLGQSEPHYYMVLGSGIKGVGPRMPLYSAPTHDLTSWTFLGALWEPEANSSFGPVLATGNNAFNFEVSGFYSMTDRHGDLHYYTTMGTEGGEVSFHNNTRWSLWNEGIVSRRDNGSVQFNPIAASAADWGLGYAVASFNDTKNDRRIQWVWAPEDIRGDAGLFSTVQQGFQGAYAIPRVIFPHETCDVLNPNGTLANGDVTFRQNENGTYHVFTQGRKPVDDIVEGLREGSKHAVHDNSQTFNNSKILATQSAPSIELQATFRDPSGPVGLTVAASPDGEEYTDIFYIPSNDTVVVDRSHSSNMKEFNHEHVIGYFRPFTLASTGEREDINLCVILDGSLLEVFVNDRFALTTRIYPSKSCSTGYGVYVGEKTHAKFANIEAWVGLANAWPERPLNSSSELRYDTIEQSNNYTWWDGM